MSAKTPDRDELDEVRDESTAVDPGGEPIDFDYDAWTIEQLLAATLPAGDGRFELRREIGHGGMGSVFLAVDRALRRPVALKQLDDAHATQVGQVANFLREARISARIDHPNLLPVYEVGVRDGHRIYFTMKLVDGEDLASRIRARPLDARSRAELLDQLDAVVRICGAVAAAHEQGYVHCDIKPANIMLARHGAVYLMDWGLARPLVGGAGEDEPDWLRDVEPLAGGTPAFMAPEQANEQPPTPMSDIFALGAVLYFVLTGQAPYAEELREDSLRRARACDFAPPSTIRGDIPPALEAIILRAMATRPDERYATVGALSAALTRYLRNGGWEFTTLRIPAGDYVVRQGDAVDAAYIIVDGRCEVTREDQGETRVLRVMASGEVFGETAILAGSPRTASVRALTDLVLYAINGEVFEREVGRWNPWVAQFVQTLARRAGGED